MSNSYYSDQAFMQLISDAIYYYKKSIETKDKFESQRFARTSILNSILTLEAAANCCIYHIDSSKRFINDIEKTTSFAKLDIFAKIHNEKFIDRSSSNYQRVSELKKVRDSFVHPKKIKVPVKFSVDENKYEKFYELGITFKENPHSSTKIDKSSTFWFSADAKSALESIFNFYDYYFIELLELEHIQVLGLLADVISVDGKENFIFHEESLERGLSYLGDIGIAQKFIKLEAVPKINTLNPK
ncbi:MAG: hypothetical protein GXP60_04200 [Epsilonproteobacteria bacterium]|nr:hypothetical protein [Campylobacterota bacterium]